MTGFSKRKQERKVYAQQKALEKAKAERRSIKREVRSDCVTTQVCCHIRSYSVQVMKEARKQLASVQRFREDNRKLEMTETLGTKEESVGAKSEAETSDSENESEQSTKECSAQFYGGDHKSSVVVVTTTELIPKDPITIQYERKA